MSSGIRLIVGLGNPGQQYQYTRHNAGAWFVERLARDCNASLKADTRYQGLVAKADIAGHEVRLLIPTTFMNLSGQSVAALAGFFRIPTSEILVAHDELDLPPGKIKLKTGGGHGGHNGLRDIIARLGNDAGFHRLRIGIGHPGSSDKVSGYVLSKASQADQTLIDATIDEALRVTGALAAGDMNKAMNRVNAYTA